MDDFVERVAHRMYQPSETPEESARLFRSAPDYYQDDWRRRAKVVIAECFKLRDMKDAPDGVILAFNPLVGFWVTRKDAAGEYPLGYWGGDFGRWFPQPTGWLQLPEPQKNTPG